MPTVSIVIPTHDRLRLLQQAITSVSQQTHTDWELLVVDDASTDDTSSFVEGLTDPRITALRLPRNVGQSAARREGTRLTGAPYLLFLDDDDVLRPDAIERLLGALQKEPAAAAVGANVEFDGRGHRRRIRHPHRAMVRSLWPELLWGWSATPSRVLLRRDALVAAGGWDPSIETAHDTDLWLRMSLSAPFVLVPATVVDKRAHEGQSRPVDSMEITTRFREIWVSQLPDEMRAGAEAVMKARKHTLTGEGRYLEGRMAEARREFLQACRAAPFLLRSPITRPYLLRDLAKASAGAASDAVLGPHRTSAFRSRVKEMSQKVLKRDPGGHRVMKPRPPRPGVNEPPGDDSN
jgi:GT2 family glycosyltransferase